MGFRILQIIAFAAIAFLLYKIWQTIAQMLNKNADTTDFVDEDFVKYDRTSETDENTKTAQTYETETEENVQVIDTDDTDDKADQDDKHK